jgi:hypothetical protein
VNTILYYTDNSLESGFEKLVQKYLIASAGESPIVSVSQKQIKFGLNVCVGNIGRNACSLFLQLLIAAQTATTKYVATAEHDCLYTREHFEQIPPRDDIFYYNVNNWSLDLETGTFCFLNRFQLSNLICNRELLINALAYKLKRLIDDPKHWFWFEMGVGEDGLRRGEFTLPMPNLDIYHGNNYTKPRNGTRKRKYLEPWGNLNDIIGR